MQKWNDICMYKIKTWYALIHLKNKYSKRNSKKHIQKSINKLQFECSKLIILLQSQIINCAKNNVFFFQLDKML